MKTYKFRVLLNTEDDVFRDIELKEDANLEELHKMILEAFKLSGQEMSSFELATEQWERTGKEFPLLDMSDEETPAPSMSETRIKDLVDGDSLKLIYIYNFLNMWVFFLDLIKVGETEKNKEYPLIALAYGEPPEESADDLDPLKGLDLGDEKGDNDEEDQNNDTGDDIGGDIDEMFRNL